MTGVAYLSLLQQFLIIGCLLTAIRLFHGGLHKRYPVFFAYMLFRIPNSLWPLNFDFRSNSYFYLYVCTLPLVLIFYILSVRELYRLVLEDYRGLQTVGRWAMYGSLAVSVFIAIATLLSNIKPTQQRSKVLGLILGSERAVDTTLALFIIILLALLSRYPIRLSRNVRGHAVIYSIFFFAGILGLLARSVLGLRNVDTWNVVGLVLNVLCVLSWFILFSPAGEAGAASPLKAAAGVRTENEKRLLLQLETLNATLLRLSRAKIG